MVYQKMSDACEETTERIGAIQNIMFARFIILRQIPKYCQSLEKNIDRLL